ncbi:hypothetical protein BQ8482_400041 [Mesorhizobium delmotii]|uniref:Uncharacterized protein n=1 Tax=Mesorhizobium delmotii TaxID=1631247 RepID=A0A2P9AT17_9HYPH|nr:hypothetical protein BQ8482_400041 [Mesorhizobium delmotii]
MMLLSDAVRWVSIPPGFGAGKMTAHEVGCTSTAKRWRGQSSVMRIMAMSSIQVELIFDGVVKQADIEWLAPRPVHRRVRQKRKAVAQ